MIVNSRDNLAYDYTKLEPPVARKPKALPARKEEERPKRAQARKPKYSRKQKVAIVMMTLVVVSTFAMVIWRYASINLQNAAVNDLKTELAEQQNINDRLQIQLVSAQNLESIKERAYALGMDFPEESQLYYFETGSADDLSVASSDQPSG